MARRILLRQAQLLGDNLLAEVLVDEPGAGQAGDEAVAEGVAELLAKASGERTLRRAPADSRLLVVVVAVRGCDEAEQ